MLSPARARLLSSPSGVQALLRGLPGVRLGPPPPHAVRSADWYQPTIGETTPAHQSNDTSDQDAVTQWRDRLIAEREDAETACRAALAGQPRQLDRFDQLLEVAQRYAVIREEQARDFTLAWPLLRRCIHRLGPFSKTDPLPWRAMSWDSDSKESRWNRDEDVTRMGRLRSNAVLGGI